jgi:hypothetical protein
MPFVFKRLALLFLSISACMAADKETPFKAAPAASYPSHQTNAQITIGADPFVLLDKVKLAFGKLDPNQFGVLPVLIVIQNDSDKSIRLDRIKLEYVGGDRQHVDAIPARDVRYLKGVDRPNVMTGPTGKPKILKQKNPLNEWEIEGRAFSAEILPPGQSASGFFYFQAALQHGASVYINGLYEAGTGKELFYFELPLK